MSHHLLRLRSTLQSSVLILLSAALVPTAAAREITFSGRTWDVKSGDGRGPGPNDWSDAPESVSVDDAGDLHLKIRSVNGRWLTSEITSQDTVGYGRYAFRLQSDPETYDPNVVVGLFVYENDEQEIDIEFSRWGDPQAPTYAQYATQPYATPGNLHTFDMELDGDYSTHLIDWTPERLTFTSIHGHHRSSPPGGLIEQWVYAGDDIPVPSGERLHVNFWLFRGAAPVDGLEHELVVDRITYTPLADVPEPSTLILAGGLSALLLRRQRSAEHGRDSAFAPR